MYEKSKVVVLSSKTIGAGYVAIASLDTSSKDTDAIVAAVQETMDAVTCGFVTRATRDTSIDGFDICKDDCLGISGGTILSDADNVSEAVVQLCDKMQTADHDVALIFSGDETQQIDNESLINRLQGIYPRTEFILTEGNQPVYKYIIVLC